MQFCTLQQMNRSPLAAAYRFFNSFKHWVDEGLRITVSMRCAGVHKFGIWPAPGSFGVRSCYFRHDRDLSAVYNFFYTLLVSSFSFKVISFPDSQVTSLWNA